MVHVLPTSSVTLEWIHSVEKTPWQEDYVVRGAVLVLREARIKTSGAGMDPPPDAVWSGGWWRYRPAVEPLREVTLANSRFAAGYRLCWEAECRPLDAFVAKGTMVKLSPMPCAQHHAAG